MDGMNRAEIEALVRRVIEQLMIETNDCPVKKIAVPALEVTEAHRMDTGNPRDRVWTRDLFTLEESPRLGCGLMVMEHTTFPWTLHYDEIDYVVEGKLSILIDGKCISAGPGEIILIPKGSSIQFSAEDKARFLYFVYPANWQEQA